MMTKMTWTNSAGSTLVDKYSNFVTTTMDDIFNFAEEEEDDCSDIEDGGIREA